MAADRDVVRRLTEEVFVGGDFSHWDDLVDESFVDHDPMPGMANDKKAQRDTAEMVVAGFSERRMIMDELVDTTDGRVVENWIMTAKHSAEMIGIPPSNQDVRVRGMELWRVTDGKITEHWGVIDISDVLEKAGVIPS